MLETDFFAALRRMKASIGPARTAASRPAALTAPAKPALPGGCPHAVGPVGLAMIQRFEGCARRRKDGRVEAYPDPGTGASPWTIGWGATGKGIRKGTVWTQDACDARLEDDLVRFASEVTRALDGAPTTQNQFDALVSFHYNTGAVVRATLTRLHKAGRYSEAAEQFGKWVHAGGKRLNGLARRRAAEAALYRTG